MRMGGCSAEQQVATNAVLKRRWTQVMVCGDSNPHELIEKNSINKRI